MTKAELQAKYGDEEVLVVPFTACECIRDHYSKNELRNDEIEHMLSGGKFMLRSDVEGVTALQQVIPYVYITCKDNYFVSRRKDGDERLVGKLSLGFGGHINPCDCVTKTPGLFTVYSGLFRELEEETTIAACCPDWGLTNNVAPCGFVRDLGSTTPDHVGFVYHAKVLGISASKLAVKETDTLEGIWMSEDELVRNLDRFESWAQYIIANIALQKVA